MDRVSIWPGQIPLDTDFLAMQRYAMEALGRLAWAALGSDVVAHGLACTQQATPNMSVLVGAGSLYVSGPVDQTAHASLAPDTTHQVILQGILRDAITIPLTAPATVGQSINYLIQAGVSVSDTDSLNIPFYNASNPSQPFTASRSKRRSIALPVNAKPGTAATTGTQNTPSPDAGFTGLYVVTVANGASTVVNANIATVFPSPFLRAPNAKNAQTNSWISATDTGTANALVIALDPVPTSYPNLLCVKKSAANNTGGTTINPNSLGAVSVLSKTGGALSSGDWPASTVRLLAWTGAAYQIVGG